MFVVWHTEAVFSWRRQWHPTPVLLPGKSHGRRSLVGCSPWGCEELDTTERLHFHFSLSCIGEGNANPLQCSCLENPRDGGAWWAAVYGVAQSQTRLKRLSSSSRLSSLETFVFWHAEAVFFKGCWQCPFPPTLYWGSISSWPSPTFTVCRPLWISILTGGIWFHVIVWLSFLL